jgi:Fur family ferric uptake transcriptional regulator
MTIIINKVNIVDMNLRQHNRGCRRRGHGCGIYSQAGYRLTAPRKAVLDYLQSTGEHVSAEDVYMAIKDHCPSIGLTTVYRTLELLASMGVVVKAVFGDGRARFELAALHGGKEHHHHLVCTSCGRIVDYSDFVENECNTICNLEKALSDKFGFAVTSHAVQFYGLCGVCQKKISVQDGHAHSGDG